VDICVIGPGAGWHGEPVDRLSPEGVAEDVQHELAPFLHLMPLMLPAMYERGWGRVIGLAMHPGRLSPAYAYNLGKAARIQAFLLAHEQAWRSGVTMNVIAPGPVWKRPSHNVITGQSGRSAEMSRRRISRRGSPSSVLRPADSFPAVCCRTCSTDNGGFTCTPTYLATFRRARSSSPG
jgi:NAD(P)-dependent dehydrogenase (short-subunit alcohol dehydrogenase family)